MARGHTGPTPINEAIARQREDDVTRLRTRERLTWKEIGARLECDERACREAWTRARAKSNTDAQAALDAWRGEQLAVLDAVVDGMMPRALAGDSKAADAITRAQERTSRLLGLDAPLKANITITAEQAARVKALAEEVTAAARRAAAQEPTQ